MRIISCIITFLMVFYLNVLSAEKINLPVSIAVNQLGYFTHANKYAIAINANELQHVELVNADNHEIVDYIKLKRRPIYAKQENLFVKHIHFDHITTPGRYYLKADNEKSHVFTIGDKLHEDTATMMLRSYYLQRCGVALDDPITGIKHKICHTHDGVFARSDEFNKKGERHSATGGWHDAGDFGKYIAPAVASVNRLISLYLVAPERYQDKQLSIPESGNGKSDLLDEIKYKLDWMLKMQRQDGAVYRKLSGDTWISHRVPEKDTDTRYIFGISSPETGKFAAAMAMAARAFKDYDAELAERYLAAAKKAFSWLKQNPKQYVDWHESDDTGSGKYLLSEVDQEPALKTDADDRLAAAIELYLTTGDAQYLKGHLIQIYKAPYTLFEWKDVSALSMWHLLEFDDNPKLKKYRKLIKRKLLSRARKHLYISENSPFKLANKRLVWGSNKMTAEEGITLLHAWRYTGNKRYLTAAIRQMDFIFGANPFDLSYVTATGSNSVKTPTHLFGTAIKQTLPGLMVGGPNSMAQDGIAPKDKGILSYIDSERAYSVNEYAIDYNSAFIGLLELYDIYVNQTSESLGKD